MRADDDTVEASASTLIVDDSRVSGRKLAMAVKALGHQAKIAMNGRQAMEMLAAESFDIVLLDIVMPEMDGYAVLAEMKADVSLRDVPVIVVSSLDDEIGSVARAIELGAEDFLPKDFEPTILKARINASLARKRLRDPTVPAIASHAVDSMAPRNDRCHRHRGNNVGPSRNTNGSAGRRAGGAVRTLRKPRHWRGSRVGHRRIFGTGPRSRRSPRFHGWSGLRQPNGLLSNTRGDCMGNVAPR